MKNCKYCKGNRFILTYDDLTIPCICNKNNNMSYIYLNKETNKYRLFGSLPIMCKSCELDYTHLQYAFRNNNTEYENETVRIIKVSLERGGKINSYVANKP